MFLHPKPIFAFDLDGTITRKEILPELGAAFGLEKIIRNLTTKTLCGKIPFQESFAKRFELLNRFELDEIQKIIADTPLEGSIVKFIQEHSKDCIVVTGNLDLWIEPVMRKIPCQFYTSHGEVENSKVHLKSIMDKGKALENVKNSPAWTGRPIIAIGESVGDIPMFLQADMGIAFAGVHNPVQNILDISHAVFHDAKDLCDFLETIYAFYEHQKQISKDKAPETRITKDVTYDFDPKYIFSRYETVSSHHTACVSSLLDLA